MIIERRRRLRAGEVRSRKGEELPPRVRERERTNKVYLKQGTGKFLSNASLASIHMLHTQTNTYTQTHTNKQTNKQTLTHTNTHRQKLAGRQAGRPTDRQTVRQTDRQTDR